MKQTRTRHHRVALNQIHPSPENGIYLSREEANQICGYAIITFFILLFFALRPCKS